MSPVRRIVRAADFQRLLGIQAQSRSAHFAIHHLAQSPLQRVAPVRAKVPEAGIQALDTELSTGSGLAVGRTVDEPPQALWLGYVVPKRHAKRAVTRSLLKRQIRSAFDRHAAGLPRGLWLVRLRHPFASAGSPGGLVSAGSAHLAAAARSELNRLLAAWPRSAPEPRPQG